MSYATITRGEFGGDRLTIGADAALRDVRFSYKARGLLAFIVSHRQGWGVTEKQFATTSPKAWPRAAPAARNWRSPATCVATAPVIDRDAWERPIGWSPNSPAP